MGAFTRLTHGSVNAWKTHNQVVATAIERVVGPGGANRCNGQVGPLPKLHPEQRPTNDTSVSTSLWCILPATIHTFHDREIRFLRATHQMYRTPIWVSVHLFVGTEYPR